MPTKTAIELDYEKPNTDDRTESKNYDILPRRTDDKRSPVIIGSNGALYIKKGLVDMAKLKKLTLTITVETK